MRAEIPFRIGGAALAFVSLGFGIPAVIGAMHFARTGSVWQLMGFPTYDPSTFDRWGVRLPPVALMTAFAIVCALGSVAAAGLLIAPSRSTGTVAAIAALPLIAAQSVFWIGFALPFGPPLGAVASVGIVAGLVIRIGGGRPLPAA